MLNYAAQARAHVYFFMDRKDGGDRNLIRADQVAVEVFWAAPNRTKQRIVGMRDASWLPNAQVYHLDHLTVVQDDFADVIRLGDGDEVSTVPHPAAPGSDSIYDFRLADSLTLRLAGTTEPIRVYEVEVRPRRFDRPAFVGSMFVDRGSASIVRMSFTFTPRSYVDRRLDYIHVSLENGLWNGRHWLPHEQRLEIRRQWPEFDFQAGTVIQVVTRIGEYEFNQPLPENTFVGRPVIALPQTQRQAFPFEQELLADWEVDGPPPLAPLQLSWHRALEIVNGRSLSGLPRLRLHVPNASAVFRYNRAEAVFFGAGLSYTLDGTTRVELSAGQATSLNSPYTGAALRKDLGGGARFELEAYRNAARDLGLFKGAPGAFNTLSTALTGSDYLDPYFSSGTNLELTWPAGTRWQAGLALSGSQERSAEPASPRALFWSSVAPRPILPIDEGTHLGASLWLRRLDRSVIGEPAAVKLSVGSLDGEAYVQSVIELATRRRLAGPPAAEIDLKLAAGASLGEVPVQRLFFQGGRGTLPGYGFREFTGRHFALAQLDIARDLAHPWIRLHALGAVGWTRAEPTRTEANSARSAGGLKPSAGAGVGIFYDLLRVHLVRGLRGGNWEAVLSVSPSLWDIL